MSLGEVSRNKGKSERAFYSRKRKLATELRPCPATRIHRHPSTDGSVRVSDQPAIRTLPRNGWLIVPMCGSPSRNNTYDSDVPVLPRKNIVESLKSSPGRSWPGERFAAACLDWLKCRRSGRLNSEKQRELLMTRSRSRISKLPLPCTRLKQGCL